VQRLTLYWWGGKKGGREGGFGAFISKLVWVGKEGRGEKEGKCFFFFLPAAAAALRLQPHPKVDKTLLDLLGNTGEAGTADFDQDLLKLIKGEEVGDGVLVLFEKEGGREEGR